MGGSLTASQSHRDGNFYHNIDFIVISGLPNGPIVSGCAFICQYISLCCLCHVMEGGGGVRHSFESFS